MVRPLKKHFFLCVSSLNFNLILKFIYLIILNSPCSFEQRCNTEIPEEEKNTWKLIHLPSVYSLLTYLLTCIPFEASPWVPDLIFLFSILSFMNIDTWLYIEAELLRVPLHQLYSSHYLNNTFFYVVLIKWLYVHYKWK